MPTTKNSGTFGLWATNKVEKKYDMKINVKKAKVMKVYSGVSKRKKAFIRCIIKEKAMSSTHLERRESCERSN